MTRPRTPIGTFGEIEFKKLANGAVRARTRFRDHDGQMRRIEASGDTRTRAEHRLKEKLAAEVATPLDFGPVGGQFSGLSPRARMQGAYSHLPGSDNLPRIELRGGGAHGRGVAF